MSSTVLAGPPRAVDANPNEVAQLLTRIAAAGLPYVRLRATHPSGVVVEVVPMKSMSTGELMVRAEEAMDGYGISYVRLGTVFEITDLPGQQLNAAEVLAWLDGTHARFAAPAVAL